MRCILLHLCRVRLVIQVLEEKREAEARGQLAGYCLEQPFVKRNRRYLEENTRSGNFTRCTARTTEFDHLPA